MSNPYDKPNFIGTLCGGVPDQPPAAADAIIDVAGAGPAPDPYPGPLPFRLEDVIEGDPADKIDLWIARANQRSLEITNMYVPGDEPETWSTDPENDIYLSVEAVTKLVPIAQAFLKAHAPAHAAIAPSELEDTGVYWIKVKSIISKNGHYTTIGRWIRAIDMWSTLGTDAGVEPDEVLQVLSKIEPPEGVTR